MAHVETKKITKNDQAWEELFAEHNILREVNEKGYYVITAKDIGKYGKAD